MAKILAYKKKAFNRTEKPFEEQQTVSVFVDNINANDVVIEDLDINNVIQIGSNTFIEVNDETSNRLLSKPSYIKLIHKHPKIFGYSVIWLILHTAT